MKQDRMQKSEYLFREIGNVHDRWVTEALTYRPKRSFLPRVIPIAAAIALSASLLVATVLVGLHQSAPDRGNNGASLGDSVGNSEQPARYALDELLYECRTTQSTSFTVLSSPDRINFFSSEVQVAWQYADSSAVYLSRALTQTEIQSLEKHLEGSTAIGDTPQQPSCKVWILYGDGRVISPYLHPSIGNTGEGELFDYNIEIVPNADFSSCLSEILK